VLELDAGCVPGVADELKTEAELVGPDVGRVEVRAVVAEDGVGDGGGLAGGCGPVAGSGDVAGGVDAGVLRPAAEVDSKVGKEPAIRLDAGRPEKDVVPGDPGCAEAKVDAVGADSFGEQCADVGPRIRARGESAASTIVTRAPSARAVEATSQPMKPPPTITSRTPGARRARSRLASASVRRLPRRRGRAPVARTRWSQRSGSVPTSA
jgi:hypothetical protein